MSDKKGFNTSGRNEAIDGALEEAGGKIILGILGVLAKPFLELKIAFNFMIAALKVIWTLKKTSFGKITASILLGLIAITGLTIYLVYSKVLEINFITIGIFVLVPLYLLVLGIVINDTWGIKREYILRGSILIVCIVLYFIQVNLIGYVNIITIFFFMTPLFLYCLVQIIFSKIFNSEKYFEKFEAAGLKNRMFDTITYPMYIGRQRLGEKKAERYVYRFSTNIIKEDWESKKKQLEQQFDTKITNLDYSKNTKKVIEMTIFNGKLPDEIEWTNDLKEKDGVIALGQGYNGKVILDLNKYPHGVIVGITGVGKTTSGQNLIHQLKDESDIYLIDFKGLLDFMFHDKVVKQTVTSLEQFEELLEQLIEEANKRKALLTKMKAKNFLKYNQLVPKEHKMKRIVLFMDEIAEVTSLGKESADILKKLCTFARITRALGFNLIFLTQRASRENLPGDIQDNLSWRMTGHLPTAVSSRIVLDSDLAAHLPLKAGYMALRCSSRLEEFQSYYMDVENHLEEYGYTKEVIEQERQAALNELEGIEETNVISFSNKKSEKTKVELDKKDAEDHREEPDDKKDNYGLNPLE